VSIKFYDVLQLPAQHACGSAAAVAVFNYMQASSASDPHALLHFDALLWRHAAHGTNVDGTWMKPHNGRQLQKGNVVRFGASSRQYKLVTLPSDVPAS